MHRDVVVVGASAGSVEALQRFASNLPADFPAAVLVVLHRSTGETSGLARLLAQAGPLPAMCAEDGMTFRPGHIQIARPDQHLLVVDEHLRLSRGPTENGHRPAVDALFRSAARAFGPRVIGIVFSGLLDDGTAGMVSIASRAGVTVVQDPEDALYPTMPRSVLRRLRPDHVVSAAEMSKVLAERVTERLDTLDVPPMTPLDILEAQFAEQGMVVAGPPIEHLGQPSGMTCPDCAGSLLELEDSKRYRCRVGHAWTADALLGVQTTNLEHALWTALRLLEERASLARDRLNAGGQHVEEHRNRYWKRLTETGSSAEALRRFLLSGLPPGMAVDEGADSD